MRNIQFFLEIKSTSGIENTVSPIFRQPGSFLQNRASVHQIYHVVTYIHIRDFESGVVLLRKDTQSEARVIWQGGTSTAIAWECR